MNLFLLVLGLIIQYCSSGIVEITQGKLQGKEEKCNDGHGFHSFRNIPYGAPPVGNLRFKVRTIF